MVSRLELGGILFAAPMLPVMSLAQSRGRVSLFHLLGKYPFRKVLPKPFKYKAGPGVGYSDAGDVRCRFDP